MGVYSTTQALAYADQIKAVYRHLDEIRKVAGRLTPVEDLTSFQTQIEALYTHLDVLVETAEVIANATPIGEQILTGTKASIQALLDIGVFPEGIVWQDELDAALANLQTWIGNEIAPLLLEVQALTVSRDEIVQWQQTAQTDIDGLKIDYENLYLGDQAHSESITQLQNRVTVNEQNIAVYGEQLDLISADVANVVTGMQSANDILAGHTSSIESLANSTTLNTASIDALSSELTNTNTNVSANADAISEMETTITAIGDDIIAQSNRTTALQSVIGGSGNLLPDADFASGFGGWTIIVAEEDWASTVLTRNTFTMPEAVNCLEVLGTPTPNGKIVVQSPAVLIKGGQYYGISGYPCVDNGLVELSYKAFNAAGTVIDQGICPATFNVTTNPNFDNYTRTWLRTAIMPTGATTLRLYLTVTGDGDFITQGALFRPMVEQAWSEQEGPSAWTPNVGGSVDALATAVQTLTTLVDSVDMEAISELVTTLTARVANAEGALANELIIRASKDAVQAGALNLMEVRLTDAESTVTAAASIASSMDARVTATESGLVSQTAAMTSLQSSLGSLASDNLIWNAAFADPATGAPEGWGFQLAGGTAHGSQTLAYSYPPNPMPGAPAGSRLVRTDVTNLNPSRYAYHNAPSTVAAKMAKAIEGQKFTGSAYARGTVGRAFRVVIRFFDAAFAAIGSETSSGTYNFNSDTLFQRRSVTATAPAGSAYATLYIRTLDGATLLAGGFSEVGSPQLETGEILTAWRPNVANAFQINALSTAMSALTTRVTQAENDIDVVAGSVTSLQSDLTAEVNARSTAVSGLQTQVNTTNGNVTAVSSSVTTLSTTVGGHTSTISSQQTSINGLSAKVGVQLDVNGYMTGWVQNNNGSSGSFTINADYFSIVKPGGGARLEWSGGNLRVYDGGGVLRVRLGVW